MRVHSDRRKKSSGRIKAIHELDSGCYKGGGRLRARGSDKAEKLTKSLRKQRADKGAHALRG